MCVCYIVNPPKISEALSSSSSSVPPLLIRYFSNIIIKFIASSLIISFIKHKMFSSSSSTMPMRMMILILTAIIIAINTNNLVSASGVATKPGFPCQPPGGYVVGVNYSEFTCDPGEALVWLAPRAALALAPFAVGIIIFVFTILLLIGRYCCQWCGGSKRRPGHCCVGGQHWDDLPNEDIDIAYDSKMVLATKILVIIAAILTIVAAAVSFMGASDLGNLPKRFVDGAVIFGDWVIAGFDSLLAGFSPSRSEFAAVRTQVSNARAMVIDYQGSIKDFSTKLDFLSTVALALAGPTALLALGGIGGIIAAVCSIRSCVPLLIVIITTLVCVVLGVQGALTGTVNLVFEELYCSEVRALQGNTPGFFNSFFIPTVCEEQLDVRIARGNVYAATNDLANIACGSITDQCSPGAAFSTGDNKFYRCDNSPNCTYGVTTAADVDALIKSLLVKTGISGNGVCDGGNCTISDCATRCTNADVKNVSTNINGEVTDVLTAVTTVNQFAGSYLNCRSIATEFTQAFGFCTRPPNGIGELSAGAAVGLTGGVLLIAAMFLGQKRFFTSRGFNKEEAELTLISRF